MVRLSYMAKLSYMDQAQGFLSLEIEEANIVCCNTFVGTLWHNTFIWTVKFHTWQVTEGMGGPTHHHTLYTHAQTHTVTHTHTLCMEYPWGLVTDRWYWAPVRARGVGSRCGWHGSTQSCHCLGPRLHQFFIFFILSDQEPPCNYNLLGQMQKDKLNGSPVLTYCIDFILFGMQNRCDILILTSLFSSVIGHYALHSLLPHRHNNHYNCQ